MRGGLEKFPKKNCMRDYYSWPKSSSKFFLVTHGDYHHWSRWSVDTKHFNPFMHNVVKCPNILYKSCGVNTARFLKNVWPFYNFMHERAKWNRNKIGNFKEMRQLTGGIIFVWFIWAGEVTIFGDSPLHWVGKLSGFQILILFLNSNGESTFLISRGTISYFFGPKYDKVSSPLTLFSLFLS